MSSNGEKVRIGSGAVNQFHGAPTGTTRKSFCCCSLQLTLRANGSNRSRVGIDPVWRNTRFRRVRKDGCINFAIRAKAAKTQETKSGIPVYDGSPSGFFEWEFRTLLKPQSCGDDEERKKLGARVCEGPTGEAFRCAMDIGLTELGKENVVSCSTT